MWTIHSIGDSAFLAEVLNSVAMIVGAGEFIAVAQIGLFMGVLLVFFQAIAAGARAIDWQKALLGWIIFSILFGPTTTVTIEDAYTGQVRVVDNVPLGVATGGSIISEAGYQLTLLFEQGFSMPSMTEHGYGSALDTLKKVRLHTGDATAFGPANNWLGGRSNFDLSWSNYIRECTTTGLSSGVLAAEDIYNKPDLVQALRFESQIWKTELWINNGSAPTNPTCTDGHTDLATATPGFITEFKRKMLTVVLGEPDEGAVTTKISDALLALGITTVTADQYITTAVLQPIFERGALARAEDDRAFTYAKMIEDAKNQRTAAWLGEASMFRSIVHPMLTFLEAFTYAVTPIMGFLVVIGPFGISVAAKYLLTLLWIQLWMPVLAIVNLYIHMSVTGKLAALEGTSDIALNTMNGLLAADGVLQKWISTGEMLASSTPALTLMLVYGGAVTATHLAGRLQGGDYLGESKVARDTIAQDPRYRIGTVANFDAQRGWHATGAERSGLLSFTSSSQGAIDSSTSRSEQLVAQTAYSRDVARSLDQNWGVQTQGLSSQFFSDGRSLGQGQSSQMLLQNSEGVMRAYGNTRGITKELVAQIGATAAVGGDLAGLAGGIQQRTGMTAQQTQQFLSDIKSAYGENWGKHAQFMATSANEVKNGVSNAFTHGLSSAETERLTQSASDLASKTQQYQESVRRTDTLGTARTLDGVTAATGVHASAAASAALNDGIQRHGLGADVQAYYDNNLDKGLNLRKQFDGDTGRALTYAKMAVLEGHGLFKPTNGLEAAQREDAVNQALDRAFGSNTPDSPVPDQGRGMTGDLAHGTAQDRVTSNWSNLGAQVQNQANTGIARQQALGKQGEGESLEPGFARAREENRKEMAPVRLGIANDQGEQLERRADEITNASVAQRLSGRADGVLGQTWKEIKSTFSGTGGEQYVAEQMKEHYEYGKHNGLTDAEATAFAAYRSSTGLMNRINEGLLGNPANGSQAFHEMRDSAYQQVAATSGQRVANMLREAGQGGDSQAEMIFKEIQALKENQTRRAELNAQVGALTTGRGAH